MKSILKNNICLLSCLLILTCLVYWPTMHNGYVDFDDRIQITNNTDIRNLSWQSAGKIFNSFYAGMYQPITTLSYAVENKLFNSGPAANHMISLLLHLINISLVFYLVYKLTKHQLVSLAMAALFALEPLNVETVAWASARSNLLAATFFLGCLMIYLQYLANQRWWRILIINLLFILALMCKVTVIILPLILWLADWYYGRRDWQKMLAEKFSLLVIAAIFAALAVMPRDNFLAVWQQLHSFSWWNYPVLILYLPVFYLAKIIAPLQLNIIYTYPIQIGWWLPWKFYLIGIFSCCLIWLCWHFRNNKIILSGSLFFIIALLPMLKIVPYSDFLTSERYTYLSGLGIFAILACLIYLTAKRWPQSKNYLLIICLLYLTALAYLANQRVQIWHNSLSLWQDVAAKRPSDPIPHLYIAKAQYQRNNFPAALSQLNQAIKLKSDYGWAYYLRGRIQAEVQPTAGACQDLKRAVELNVPDAKPIAKKYCSQL